MPYGNHEGVSPSGTSRNRAVALLAGATAVLVVFGLTMTGLFIFKNNQQIETRTQLAAAQSAATARQASVAALSQQLAAVQGQLTDVRHQLTVATKDAATTRANRQLIGACLTLVSQALQMAKSGSGDQLDAALKRMKAPCARAQSVA